MVIVVDDADRENEGDLVMAGEKATPAAINFMARFGRGLICVPTTEERLQQLGIEVMVARNQDSFRTDFQVSVDAATGVTTGISAADRARTIRVMCDPTATPADLRKPGHVFPLRAKPGGVLRRAGHTEAAVDLARLPQLRTFARKHRLKVCTIADLIHHRRTREKLVERVETIDMPTDYGDFKLHLYRSQADGEHHIALVKGDPSGKKGVLVRVHSECLTGDVFGSRRCDCGPQLQAAMQRIADEGCGVVLYMRQEGRGIGLANKLKAYSLQDRGLDTVEANTALGFKPDLREYGAGAQILQELGLSKLRLITNNPRKIVGLEGYGLRVVERISIPSPVHKFNAKYLRAKKDKLDHILEI